MVNLKPANKNDQKTSTVKKHRDFYRHQWLFILASVLFHGLFLLLFVAYQRLQPVIEDKAENKPIEFVVVPEEESEEPPETNKKALENSVAEESAEPEKPAVENEIGNEAIPDSPLEEPVSEGTTALSPEPAPIPEPEPIPVPQPEMEVEPEPEPIPSSDVPLAKLPKPEPLPESLPEPEPTPTPEPEPEPIPSSDVPLAKLPKPEPEPLPQPEPIPVPQSENEPEPEPEPEPIPEPSVATNLPSTQSEPPQTATAPLQPTEDSGASALLGGDYQRTLANGGGDAFFSEEALAYKSVLNPNQLNALKDIDLSAYLAEVKRRVESDLNYPHMVEEYTTLLTFNIKKNGQITGLRVTQSSGSSEVDRKFLDAVQKSAPFTPLPAEFPLAALEITYSFNYRFY